MNWQPISTAPKDGTLILTCDAYHSMAVLYWRHQLKHWDNCFDLEDCEPTHWMPLPPPPVD